MVFFCIRCLYFAEKYRLAARAGRGLLIDVVENNVQLAARDFNEDDEIINPGREVLSLFLVLQMWRCTICGFIH